jgi:hypothetical protein
MNRTLGTLATVAVLALLIAVFLGQRWKGDAGRRAVEFAQARERYTADSADFALRVQALEDSIGKLTVAGDSLRAGWAISHEAAGAALVTLRDLASRLSGGDRAAVNVAVGTIIEERQACSLVVANCEARAQAERSGRLEALARLRASDSLRSVTELARVDAERRAAPWGIGATAGFGGVVSGGQFCSGAGVTAGVTYRKSFRLPWPFR